MTSPEYVPKPLVTMTLRSLRIHFFFAWFDLWVGLYVDQKTPAIYVCPLPCCVFLFYKVKK